MKKLLSLGLVAALLVMWGCAGYEYKPVPFRSAESYTNHVTVFGAVIAAHAWTDKQRAQEAFGFDIRGAGLTPVQVVVDNKGPESFILVPDQTLVKDTGNQFWNILPASVAYERIDKQVAGARTVGQAAKTGVALGAAGAIIGAAIGIIAGSHVGSAAGKGAVAGAAAGAVIGGFKGYNDPESQRRISEDLVNRSLQDKAFAPHQISHGFLFFPGEIKDPAVLRLKLQNVKSGEVRIVELSLLAPAQ